MADDFEISTEVSDVPTGDFQVSTASDLVGSFANALPNAATSAIASISQKASELSRSLGGLGKQSKIKPQNAADKLTSPAHTTADFKLRLTSCQNGRQVIFNVSPMIEESRAANYDHQAVVHHPGTIQVYKSTEARTFNISVKLIARTSIEATENLKYLNLIRSWVMPYYGQGTGNSEDKNRLGAPPDILLLDAYGERNISSIPTVLTSYHWAYPTDVDYIPTTDGLPFPTIIDISLSLIESYSPEQYTGFDITKYRSGDMVGAYTFSTTPPVSQEISSNEGRNSVAPGEYSNEGRNYPAPVEEEQIGT
jgi:hypothetical protein